MKIKRLSTGSNFVYENVELIKDLNSQKKIGIEKYLTADYLDQIVIKSNDGDMHVITDWQLALAEVRHMKPPIGSRKIKQIVINGETSFGPAFLIPESYWANYKIPRICNYQFAFVSDNILYVSRQAAS